MRVSDWSSDVCSSDLASGDKEQAFADRRRAVVAGPHRFPFHLVAEPAELADEQVEGFAFARRIRIPLAVDERSEEHTSELQSLMRISYAVFCLKKKNKQPTPLEKLYLHIPRQ